MSTQVIVARERKVNPRTLGVPDLRGGEQRLDVRFIQFDNVVIELLQSRDAAQPQGTGDSWAEPRDHMSPAFPRSMHICFYLHDDVDFNQFFLQENRETPGHFVFYEVFASQRDFEAHNAMPYVKAWFAKLPELADGGVKVTRMAVLADAH